MVLAVEMNEKLSGDVVHEDEMGHGSVFYRLCCKEIFCVHAMRTAEIQKIAICGAFKVEGIGREQSIFLPALTGFRVPQDRFVPRCLRISLVCSIQ